VIVLGDLASLQPFQPLVVAWSADGGVAPVRFQRTIAFALRQQTGLRSETPSTGTQLARFAFPFALGDQGGSGRRDGRSHVVDQRRAPTTGPRAGQRRADDRRGSRRAARDDGARSRLERRAAPSPVLVTGRKSVPTWAIRVLVAALLLAPLVCAVDDFARLRRRHESVVAGLVWIARRAVPFLAVFVLVRLFGVLGLLPDAADCRRTGRDRARWHCAHGDAGCRVVFRAGVDGDVARAHHATGGRGTGHRRRRGRGGRAADRAVGDRVHRLAQPFAALLFVPALHLWLPIYAPGVSMRRAAALALFVLGLLPFVLVALADAASLRMGADDLMVVAAARSGGTGRHADVGVVESGRRVRCRDVRPRAALAPGATGRGDADHGSGPLTYAGPGSLGGTESAL
jgi:hypothetical protein